MRVCKITAMLLVMLVLCSCNSTLSNMLPENNSQNDAAVTSFTDPLVPEDGGLYIDSATSGEVLDYFSEIAFGSEYGESSGRLCRWEKEITYTVTGDYRSTDTELIGILAQTLNEIEGFPGIREASAGEKASLEIMFIPRSSMAEEFEYADESCAGMSEYTWLSESCEIISARAAIDSEESKERASTICEEVLQSLGLAMDSYAHADSVFYQGTCVYQRPSELDWTVIKVLYHPKLTTGMSKYEAITAAAGILAW